MVPAGSATGPYFNSDYYPLKPYILLIRFIMYKKLNNLGFVIGIFFTIISLILLIGRFVSAALHTNLNLYTGIAFLVFGLAMAGLNLEGNTDNDE